MKPSHLVRLHLPLNLIAHASKMTVKVTVKSPQDQRDKANLPLELITNSSKRTNRSVGTVKATKLKTAPLKDPLMKFQPNTSPSTVNTTLRRPSLTLPPVKLERQVKLPTASEERALNTSVRSLDNLSQSHSLEDN